MRHSLYWIWHGMHKRCYDPRYKLFRCYGGRGVSVCDRWHTFENFVSDVGIRPTSKHQLDRINSDGNYEPNNCRWATQEENQANRRPNQGKKFKGTILNKKTGKYEAYIRINKIKYHLGLFNTETEAAAAYNKIATEWWGQFAFPNRIHNA